MPENPSVPFNPNTGDNQELINFLNQEVSNLAVLYVKLHRYHWYVQGRHFFGLHDLFETLYNEASADLDEVAERILAIGGRPLATMHMYIKQSTLEEAQADDKEEEIIVQLTNDYQKLIDEVKHDGIPLAEENNDQPTVDLLTGIQGRLEKRVWMLQAYTAAN